jgi:hypothetical protein
MTIGGVGQQLKLRLFLEGIEVPVIGAQVQLNLNAPATASIQVIPVDSVMNLRPRTMVHLFYWDYNYDLPARTDFDEAIPTNRTDALDPDVQLDNYRLLFGGEVVGLVMSKSPGGRQAILQCADWSTYWDTSYQTFISYSPNGNWWSDNSSMWSGGNNMFNNFLSSHSSVMGKFLRRQPQSEGLKDVKGLMGGIISLLEAMGGVDKHVSGINDYFTIAEIKNHLMQQITADQTDNTSYRLFSGKSFAAWLNQRTTSLGELVSFRDMLKLLFHWIYYEVVPVSCPKYVPAQLPQTVTRNRTVFVPRVGVSAKTAGVIRRLLRITKRYDGSQGVQTTLRRQAELNKSSGGETRLANYEVRRQLRAILASDTRLPSVSSTAINNCIGETFNIISTNSVEISKASFEGPTGLPRKSSNNQTKRELMLNQRVWKRMTDLLLRALNGGKGSAKRKKSYKARTGVRVDRLQTQIFRPDCFFVAPPKCNVLFPEQVTQFQYQRNFLQEVTRLRLSTGTWFTKGKHGGFFQNSHMAPNLTVIKRLARSQGNRGIRTLLPWEKFTGILPKFEHISEVNYISDRASRKRRQLSQNLRGKGKAYAQRAANFNFVKYRFAPRSISVTAKFSPQFTLGFPGLIIDKPYILDPDVVKSQLSSSGVSGPVDFSIGSLLENMDQLSVVYQSPVQYLGMPAGLAHNVDQRGGVTSMTLTHARIHKITDDDYMDALLAEVKRGLNTTIRTTELDAQELLAKGDYKNLDFLIRCTPQSDIIERLRKIRDGENPEDSGRFIPSDADLQTVSSRPSNKPAALSSVAATLPRVNQNITFRGRQVTVRSSIMEDLDAAQDGTAGQDAGYQGTKFTTITGGFRDTTFLNTKTMIREPDPYGDLKPGRKGPLGGVIKHIQLANNGVLAVSSSDISNFVKSRRDRRALRRRRKKGDIEPITFLWRKVIIHEEVTSKKTVREVPIEEAIRPPWFSPQYSNLFIGDDIYQPFFGCGSLVDQSLFLTPGGSAFFGNSSSTESDRKELLGKVQSADGDLKEILRILDDAKARGVGTMPSIEAATDALAFLYGEVRRQGLDVQRFVSDYTNRPIATMRNIFGSLDLQYEVQGDGTLAKVSGEAGFHSTAVAPYGELLGLVDNPDLEIPRIRRRGKKFPISRALDPRPGRRERVVAYQEQIGASGNSLGRGVLG